MSTEGRDRIASVDAARGLAILGMVVFHLAWDLHDFGLIQLSPAATPAWQVFGHAVASAFLFLSGLGLVLAARRGAGTRQALRRIAAIAGAAIAISIVTALIAPGQAIRFGILHCIAVGNALALPLLHAPPALVVLLAGVAAAVPFVTPEMPQDTWWLGLSDRIPDTLDARPLLPWLVFILLGVAFGQIGGGAWLKRLDRSLPRPLAALGKAGRHSLAIYLIHQPVLFGILVVLTVWL